MVSLGHEWRVAVGGDLRGEFLGSQGWAHGGAGDAGLGCRHILPLGADLFTVGVGGRCGPSGRGRWGCSLWGHPECCWGTLRCCSGDTLGLGSLPPPALVPVADSSISSPTVQSPLTVGTAWANATTGHRSPFGCQGAPTGKHRKTDGGGEGETKPPPSPSPPPWKPEEEEGSTSRNTSRLSDLFSCC